MGRNRNADGEWDGGGIVIAAARPREFAWVMGDDLERPRGTWRYVLVEEGEGLTRVTELTNLGLAKVVFAT
jgi:hypothetical protein